MQLFFWINGLAGRNSLADALFRGVYVGALPLLWTLLAALLLMPRPQDAPSRWRVAGGALCGAALCLLLMAGIDWFARGVLGSAALSERPFVTRRVTALLVEPNDNSFPSPEVMLAACAAFGISVAARRGWLAWGGVALLMWARVFCGTNYPADVMVGALLGAGLSALCLAGWRASWPARARFQAALGAGGVALTLIGALWAWGATPRYRPRFATLLGGSTATAAPVKLVSTGTPMLAAQSLRARTGTLGTVREGEGSNSEAPPAAPGEATFPADATVTGGNLPQSEAHLLNALRALHLPLRLVSVDVAQVRAGTTPYRAAAVRFEVKGRGALQRRLVAATAAAIARAAFHADAELANLDVLGVAFDTAAFEERDGRPAFAGGAAPVFTASLERARALQPSQSRDAEAWLRARSLLYIDAARLPAALPHAVTAAPHATNGAPHATSGAPHATNGAPHATNDAPHATSGASQSVSGASQSVSGAPQHDWAWRKRVLNWRAARRRTLGCTVRRRLR